MNSLCDTFCENPSDNFYLGQTVAAYISKTNKEMDTIELNLKPHIAHSEPSDKVRGGGEGERGGEGGEGEGGGKED